MRLAWFTPWPPQGSGIAGRSVDVTRELASRGRAIDVFVDRRFVPATARTTDDAPLPGEVRVHSAHDFVWRHHRQQYDLVVYQLGNSRAHEFIWPYLLRYPGISILHDAHLHHARGAALLTPASGDLYRAAFRADHPEVSADVAELAVMGFDGSYYFLWPMVRSIILASRAVGVHTRGGARTLGAAFPESFIEYVALGMGRADPLPPDDAADLRRTLGIGEDALLFGVFGGLTADKRIPTVLRAFARVRVLAPQSHLLLAGAPDPRLGLSDLIDALGLAAHVTLAPALDDRDFERAVAAVDISLNLRWPTARETSGPWLQALAAARPTVVIDLEQHAHVPAFDPQNWASRPCASTEAPVTVALDILDEEHSLGLAMTGLARDPDLRSTIGRAARSYWEREHTLTAMTDGYERLLRGAIDRREAPHRISPDPIVDPLARTRNLVRPFGNLSCELF